MKQGADLERLLGYQIQRAHLLMDTDARSVLVPFGLSPAKMTALTFIRENPGCDQTALGRALSVNRSSAMKLVNILVELDLIERRSGRDLRTNALFVVDKGEELLRQMLERVHKSDAQMSERLTRAEVETLHALLRKLGRVHHGKPRRGPGKEDAAAD